MSESRKVIGSDGREHDVRWTDRTQQIFQECAEVLGTTTDLIMAAHEDGRSVMAMYTPGYPEDNTIWTAALRRNKDGTLRLTRRERSGKTFADIEAQIERDLRKKYGPPRAGEDLTG